MFEDEMPAIEALIDRAADCDPLPPIFEWLESIKSCEPAQDGLVEPILSPPGPGVGGMAVHELTLQDAISDPLIALINRADGISERSYAQLLESASRILFSERQSEVTL